MGQSDFRGPGSKADIGWLRSVAASGPDVAPRLTDVLNRMRNGERVIPPGSENYGYRLVGGIFTAHYPLYFDANLRRLHERGLDASKLRIDSDGSVAQNADAVVAALEAEPRPVVLIGHSKGCLDIAAALQQKPRVAEKVRVFIAIQAPYAGAALASDLENTPALASLVDALIRDFLHGDPQALADLTYASRRAALGARPSPMPCPTLCLASTTTSPLALTASGAEYLRRRYDALSDGLVCVEDAFIPGAAYARLADLDHAAAAMPSSGASISTGDLTEALVATALGIP